MPAFEVVELPPFTSQLEDILKKFTNSKKDIENEINNLSNNPLQGERVVGLGQLHVRKLRLPVKKYNIGKSKGLRVIFMVNEDKYKLFMICIYFKGDYQSEQQVISLIKNTLRKHIQALLIYP